MAYGEQYNNQVATQSQQQGMTADEEFRMRQEEAYYTANDPWMKQRNNDPSIQVREALYDAVDKQLDDGETFDDWISSRRLLLIRASRIPGLDILSIRNLSRKFKYIVHRAHSEGRGKTLRTKCEIFDFELELMVSRGDMEMKGVSGITSMISQNVSQKQEVRMPQQQPQPSLFSGLSSVLGRGK